MQIHPGVFIVKGVHHICDEAAGRVRESKQHQVSQVKSSEHPSLPGYYIRTSGVLHRHRGVNIELCPSSSALSAGVVCLAAWEGIDSSGA